MSTNPFTQAHTATHTETLTRTHRPEFSQYDRITDQPEKPIGVSKTEYSHTHAHTQSAKLTHTRVFIIGRH